MKSSKFFCFLLAFALVVLPGCAPKEEWAAHYAAAQITRAATPPLFGEGEAEAATPQMLAELQAAYGYDALADFRLFVQGQTVQVDFVFAGDAPRWQILSACNFAWQMLHLANMNWNHPRLFDEWLSTTRLFETGIDETLVRVFADDALLLTLHFTSGNLQAAFEDTSFVLPCREAAPEDLGGAAPPALKPGDGTVALQKPLLANHLLLVQVQGDTFLNPQKFEELKAAATSALQATPTDDWSQIAFELYQQQSLYYVEQYHTATGQYIFDDWQQAIAWPEEN